MTRRPPETTIKIAVIAAGMRGRHLAKQVTACSQDAQIVAVAEPNEQRRNEFAQKHHLANDATFTSWEELLGSTQPFDAAIVATMDNLHTEPVLACLVRGSHVLVEKPLADTLDGCRQIEQRQRETGLVVSVCHTLRYMDAFRRIKDIVASGSLGQVVHLEHIEAIDHMRFTHNYVRGRWAKEKNNTFLLLHKCCHDVDFIAWLIDKACRRVSSFGSLACFTPANAPTGSGQRCLDGCTLQNTCPYSAMRLYVDGDLTGRLGDLGNTQTRQDRLEAVRRGPFGTCVWRAGNDVVDHQVVAMEFADGATATCTMIGYSATHGRQTRLFGTKGELLFEEAEDRITLRKFAGEEPEQIHIPRPTTYHPEDRDIVENWLAALRDASAGVAVNAQEALRTHAIVFAAEQSRRENRTVDMSELIPPIQ